ncbi:MAG TPA: hypothetical protein VGD65_00880 [Chryseosolibacter sp.]
MLALILIFFVGKYFFDLAGRYDRSEWGYAILGVISYYAGTFLIGIVLGILGEFSVITNVDEIPNTVLTLLAVPAGALTSFLLYRYLENRWDRPQEQAPSELLDSELINQAANDADTRDVNENKL